MMSKKSRSNLTLARRLTNVERKLAKEKSEIHQKCVDRGPTALPVAGQLIEMSYVPTTARLGEAVFARRFINNLIFTVPKDPAVDRISVRCMVVRSKAGILTAAVMPATTYGCPDKDLYYVLQDMQFEIVANTWDGTNYAGFQGKTVRFLKRYKNGMKLQYDGGPGTTGNGLYLWIIADVAGAFYEGYNLIQYTDN